MTTQPQEPPEHVYGVYCGDINAANTAKLVNNLTTASNLRVKHVHLLFQSWGGYVGDGIFLYNAFSKFGLEVTVYNAGQVASAGVLAFMGAQHRKTTQNGVFMIHKSTNSGPPATVQTLNAITRSLILDDERIDGIFRERLKLPDEMWVQLIHHDVHIAGEDAIKFGIADALGEFAPPPGSQVFNALAG
jgi:ATP-dependent protease ClpP protease subunit